MSILKVHTLFSYRYTQFFSYANQLLKKINWLDSHKIQSAMISGVDPVIEMIH